MLKELLQYLAEKKWFLLLGLFAFIGGILILQNGHEWGDDFALYLSQANAILKGNTHQLAEYNTWSMQHSDGTIGPYLYPPGYPLFLSLYLKFFSFSWIGIKIYQWFFYVLGTIAFYSLITKFKLKVGPIFSLFLMALVLVHPKVLEFADRIMSDLWFLVTVYLFFYFLYSTEYSKRSQYALIGISLILASITRVNGFLLIGSWWIFILVKDELWSFKIREFMLSLPVVIIVLYLKKIDNQYEANHMDLFSVITLETILSNLKDYIWMISSYVFWHLRFFDFVGYIFFIPTIIFFLYGLRTLDRIKIFAPILMWIAVNFVLVVVWPIPQGTRYLLPIVPFIFWIAIVGLNEWIQNVKLNKMVAWGLVIILFVQSLASIWFYKFIENTNKVVGKNQSDIYNHIEKIVSDNDVIAFDKPRWLHLVTNKKCIRKQSDSTFFNSPAKYWLITNKNIYRPTYDNKLNNPKLDSIYGNAEFTLYRRNDLLNAK